MHNVLLTEAWKAGRPIAGGLNLNHWLEGREITGVESEMDAAGLGSVRLRFRDGYQLRLIPVRVHQETQAWWQGLRWAIRFTAAETPLIWRAPYRGDGPQITKDFAEFLVGRSLASVDTGAMTDDGLSVVRLRLDTGDQVLVFPQPVAMTGVTQVLGLRAAIRCVFQPRLPGAVVTPGELEGP